MSVSTLDDIERCWKLLNDGREEEALDLVIEIEKKENLSLEEKHRIKMLKGYIHKSLGQFKKAFNIAEDAYNEYEKMGNDFLLLDVINLKVWILFYLGKMLSKSSLDLIKRGEAAFKSISNKSSLEIAIKEARFLYLKSIINLNLGNYNIALEYNKKSLELIDKFNIDKYEDQKYRRSVVTIRGFIYNARGELDLALQCHEKSLALKLKDTNYERFFDSINFYGIGHVLYSKGDLDSALKYFKQSLVILEDLNLLVVYVGDASATLEGLIRVMIAKGDYESTHYYLDLFKQIIDEKPWKRAISSYKLLKAKALKSSTRSRERTEAENIYKEIIKDENNPSWSINAALIDICDLYLKELKLTNDLTIIDEINPFIIKLQKVAKKEKTYTISAKTNLLQARIALIQMNMGDARRFLSQAQQIADENRYHHLAQIISIEHDNLIGQLDVWEKLKKANAPLSERLDLASMKVIMDIILESRPVKLPELIDEVPVLLLIIAEGGVPAFSNQFAEDWDIEDGFISNFLTAFNTFSEEVFSKGLDRAKFGEFTLVMDSIGNFTVCYLFKGQSYLAKQKLINFAHRLQNTTPLWDVFTNYHQTHQAITLSENPALESLLREIFVK